MANRTKNCFDSSFVIDNLACKEKKSNILNFTPFGGGGGGMSDRSRGIPYRVSKGGDTGLTLERKQTLMMFIDGEPEIYYPFQSVEAGTVRNEGTLGSTADANFERFGTSGYATSGYTTVDVCSGSRSATLNVVPAESSDTNDAYVYLPPGFEGGYSPDFGTSEGQWTVSIWFKTTLSNIQNLWSVMLPGSTENTSCGLYLLANNSFVLDGNGYSQASNQLTGTAVPTIRDGNWHHCAVTYVQENDAGQRAKIYVDGTDITLADTLNVGEFGTNNDSFMIGRGLHRSAKHFSGSIGEFAYWDRKLSAGSIDKIWADGQPYLRLPLTSHLMDEKKLAYD